MFAKIAIFDSSSSSGLSKAPVEEVNRSVNTVERTEGGSTEEAKPKLKPMLPAESTGPVGPSHGTTHHMIRLKA